MSEQKLPLPGQDSQYDSLRRVIERVSMKDPDTTTQMLIAMLRFLKSHGVPGVLISFNELAAAGRPGTEYEAVCFSISMADRNVLMSLMDGNTRAEVAARVRTEHPANEQQVIDMDGPGGTQ